MLQFSGSSCTPQSPPLRSLSLASTGELADIWATAGYMLGSGTDPSRNVHSKIEPVTNPAIPAAYRIMPRSSSLKEPRHPLPKV